MEQKINPALCIQSMRAQHLFFVPSLICLRALVGRSKNCLFRLPGANG